MSLSFLFNLLGRNDWVTYLKINCDCMLFVSLTWHAMKLPVMTMVHGTETGDVANASQGDVKSL